MSEKKETIEGKGLLPRVTWGTIESMIGNLYDLMRYEDFTYYEGIEKDFKENNPVLYDQVLIRTNRLKDPSAGMRLALIMYRLLESQAEADKLGKQFYTK